MIDTVIFDFDGVILESVSVKTDAFRSLFSFVPDHIDEIIEYHLSHGGVSRFDKFRFIYQDILKKDLSEEQFNFLSEEFAKLVYNEGTQISLCGWSNPFFGKKLSAVSPFRCLRYPGRRADIHHQDPGDSTLSPRRLWSTPEKRGLYPPYLISTGNSFRICTFCGGLSQRSRSRTKDRSSFYRASHTRG